MKPDISQGLTPIDKSLLAYVAGYSGKAKRTDTIMLAAWYDTGVQDRQAGKAQRFGNALRNGSETITTRTTP